MSRDELLLDRYRILSRSEESAGQRLELRDELLGVRRSGWLLPESGEAAGGRSHLIRWERLRAARLPSVPVLVSLDRLGDGRLLQVSETVSGAPLDHYLKTLAPDSAIRLKLLAEIQGVLEELHGRGIVLGRLESRGMRVVGTSRPNLPELELPLPAGASLEGDRAAWMQLARIILGAEIGEQVEPVVSASPPMPRVAPPPVEVAVPAAAWEESFVRQVPGEFRMGSPPDEAGHLPHEGPIHPVRLNREFWLAIRPVERGEFERFVRESGHRTMIERGETVSEAGGTGLILLRSGSWRSPGFPQEDRHPVVGLSWLDALAYCNWLSEIRGLHPCYSSFGGRLIWDRATDGYRLPTEAEWEFACRAGSQTRYSLGNPPSDLDRAAWYTGTADSKSTAPAGDREPGPNGLQDMHGNVWEWCWDLYGPYTRNRKQDPTGAPGGTSRVIRGGCFHSPADECRSASRGHAPERGSFGCVGFRLARSMP